MKFGGAETTDRGGVWRRGGDEKGENAGEKGIMPRESGKGDRARIIVK
jgi:hypothetical protein